MAGKRKELPSKEALLQTAPQYPSLSKLGQSLGWKSDSFNKRLGAEGWKNEISAALGGEGGPVPVGEEVSEVEILRQRVQELERATRLDRKSKVYDERIVSAIENAVATREPKYSPAPIPKSKTSKSKHEFALLWSDLHAGETVSREETNGFNSYDWKTMLARHDRLREGLFSYQDNRPYPVETLHVFALGDHLSGNIHDELVATNEIPLAEATVQLGMDGAEWLESLTERFPRVHVSGVVGNHPRAHKKPWAKQGYDNADWTAYHVMATVLRKNKRITFDIPKASQLRVKVAETSHCLLFHGDGIRSSMPGVPWGGVMRRVNSLAAQYNAAGQPIDCYCVGHFHSANLVESNAGRIAMNGSVKGVDEYSIKAFGGGAKARQLLLTFHPRNGLTDGSLIDLQ